MNPRLLLTTVAVLATLTACSNTPDTSTEEAAAPETSASVPPTALPLTSHVVTELAGFKSGAAPVVQDLPTFAKAHHKTVAELTKIGLTSGTTVPFKPDADIPGNAFSIAEQFSSPEEAATEAARLYAANAEPDEGATGAPLDIPGIPGVKATRVTGDVEGNPFTSVEIVFVDGNVVHELFAIGGGPVVSPPEMVAAATVLYTEIHGHPVN